MKYEMIFGDPSQFEGMMPDCEYVDGNYGYKNNGDIFYYCERYNEKFGWAFSYKTNLEFRPIAMRRIIKEPKHWTWEDKKAGRLPEVGCRVDFCHKLNTNWRTGEIKYIDNQVAVIKADDIDRPFVYEFDRVEFKPIETPAEKAQRLEDEFVVAMLDAASQEQLMSAGFKSGVIAAYRKLKGGE